MVLLSPEHFWDHSLKIVMAVSEGHEPCCVAQVDMGALGLNLGINCL